MCTGLFDDGVEVWEAMMQDWYSGPHPVPNTEIGSDFDEAADVFVLFLSVVPGSEADALTRLQLPFAFESELGKHAGLNGSMALVHEHLVADVEGKALRSAAGHQAKDSVILEANQPPHIEAREKVLGAKSAHETLVEETRSSCRITDQRDVTFPAAPRELFTPPSRGDLARSLADAVFIKAVTTTMMMRQPVDDAADDADLLMMIMMMNDDGDDDVDDEEQKDEGHVHEHDVGDDGMTMTTMMKVKLKMKIPRAVAVSAPWVGRLVGGRVGGWVDGWIMALPDDTRVFVGHDYLPQDFEILL
ncbi:hypothetical protein AK812_SmicGene15169 [Symbiodinium microadriaticum]|uniref:Uncharacterized protein n=1 Tax=Symbiodinium microadriaticum TaxID=2951 RepID=A0A1Q9E3Q6_SYMMI|nr:hypothetical protein AK812_SmicGene15169 [Symbiodinium microadriaticum]CAE7938100.1 unnamed protein product [Symbiodinium sp. KB8]